MTIILYWQGGVKYHAKAIAFDQYMHVHNYLQLETFLIFENLCIYHNGKTSLN